ncbi:MAG: L-alanine-DL-glutamate epimerase-like enolase superfamily enzyme [Patiriisocius sp.]|jgi:L-alanine-DL-glutamate epimerase-like enolase superfamily enzyme
MKLTLHKLKHELVHPFTISRWTYTHTESLVVELSDGRNNGYGEATLNPYYQNTEIEYMANRLIEVQSLIDEHQNLSPELFWKKMEPALEDCPFALAALDQAFHDLDSRNKGLPLYESWGLDPTSQPQQCYTLSIDGFDTMIARMKAKPWPVYKIKLGTDRDIDMVEALRQNTDSEFWVDANCSWNMEDAIRKSKELQKLGVTLIEQPLPDDQWDEMEEVFRKTNVPLIADESCKKLVDISKCINRFHGVNIKVMKCGGLTPAKRMINEARGVNMKVMVGCMAESTVGISAIAHLAPLIDFADMDGQHFIKNDPAEGVLVSGGGIVFPGRPGTGVRIKNGRPT